MYEGVVDFVLLLLLETWKSAVFEDIDQNELPTQWGGNKPDPEGHPLVRTTFLFYRITLCTI